MNIRKLYPSKSAHDRDVCILAFFCIVHSKQDVEAMCSPNEYINKMSTQSTFI